MKTVAMLVVLVGCSSTPAEVRLRDLAALDDGSAVLVWDVANDNHVGRMSVDGELVWAAQVPTKPPYGIMGTGIATHDRVVTTRAVHDEKPRTTVTLDAFDRDLGHRLWTAEIRDVDGHTSSSLHTRTPTSMVERMGDQIVVLDPATGHERSRTSSHAYGRLTVLGEAVVADGLELMTLDATTGEASRLSAFWRGCVSGGVYSGVEIDPTGERWLVTASADDLSMQRARRIDTAPYQPTRCHSYGGRLAMEMSHQSPGRWRMQFFSSGGEQVSYIQLPGEPTLALRELARDVDRDVRFVVLSLMTRPSGNQIALIDLERRSLVWSREVEQGWDVFRVGGLWYLFNGLRSTLATIDGDTGELRGAVRFEHVRELGPHHIGGGSLWVAGGSWAKHHAVTRLDATTLTVTLPSAHVPVHDARDTPFLVDLPRPEL